MQLAPAFNLANIIADSPHNLKDPFRQLQFSNLESLVSLWRTKRDTGLVNVDEDDFVEFLDDVADFKGDMGAKIRPGGLSPGFRPRVVAEVGEGIPRLLRHLPVPPSDRPGQEPHEEDVWQTDDVLPLR